MCTQQCRCRGLCHASEFLAAVHILGTLTVLNPVSDNLPDLRIQFVVPPHVVTPVPPWNQGVAVVASLRVIVVHGCSFPTWRTPLLVFDSTPAQGAETGVERSGWPGRDGRSPKMLANQFVLCSIVDVSLSGE